MINGGEPIKYKKTLIFPAALDPDALKIIHRLRRFGHTAYLVGGCVRDLLLGSIPKDFDVATSARPRQVRRLFKNSAVVGRRFKLAHVKFGDKIIEVSTFRRSPELENHYFKSDGLLIVRDNVYGDQRDDALRRDFTINALFYDIEQEEVIDYTGGVEDIQRRVIRTISDPRVRFQEDPLRILRAIRFSCRLGLAIDPPAFEAMKTYKENITQSAPPRVTEELIRILACGASKEALALMMDLGLVDILLPELRESLDREARYFAFHGPGRDFLLRHAQVMDQTDLGKRKFENAMYLALLFEHLCGTTLDDAKKSEDVVHDPGAVLSNALRPVMIRMGVSKRDLSRIKQIVMAYGKLVSPGKSRGARLNRFVSRDYIPAALELYRQIILAKDSDLERYEWWLKRRALAMQEGERKPRPRSRNRSRGPARRRQRRPSPEEPGTA